MYKLIPIYLLLILTACADKKQADLLLINGRIYTFDDSSHVYEAMAISNGKILALGSVKELESRYVASRVKDLKGSSVIPGLIDAHSHFMGYARGLSQVNLVGVKTYAELIERCKNMSERHQDQWIIGRGWDQNDWADKRFPDRAALDSIFPDRPVFLYRIDGHAALVNGAALRIAGIDKPTTVSGGSIERRKDGSASGILIDNAVELVKAFIPVPELSQYERMIDRAQALCFERGLTTVTDAGLELAEVNTLRALERSGVLKIRVYAMLNPQKEKLDSILESGPLETERLQVNGFKIYGDGALGSRGAMMKKPYTDKPGHYGFWVTAPDSLAQWAAICYKHNWQMNVHCIGDSAVSTVLKIMASELKEKNDRRWRIEHAQIVERIDYPYFRNYSIIPSVQPTHATSDMYWAEERLGKERMRDAYAYGSLWKLCGGLPLGSDFPVEDINPWYGLYAATARQDSSGYPPEGFNKEDAISLKEAFDGFTRIAARACMLEKRCGQLKPGLDADFVIPEQDPFAVKPIELRNMKVRSTYVSGKMVYGQKD